MGLREYIIDDYRERIELRSDIPSELKKSLRTNERVPVFIDNLKKAIDGIPRKIKIDRMKLKNLVYDMTDIFINNVRTHCEQKHMSILERQMLAKRNEFELDNHGNGRIEELGVEVKDG
jgi:hypothetical protein